MVSSNVSSRSREKVLGGLRIGRILFTGIGGNLGYLSPRKSPSLFTIPRIQAVYRIFNRVGKSHTSKIFIELNRVGRDRAQDVPYARG
jgi:hypothetical protein